MTKEEKLKRHMESCAYSRGENKCVHGRKRTLKCASYYELLNVTRKQNNTTQK